MTDGTYIDNANYFTSAPQHGTNSSGTCGAVAAQLLLSYNNYYNDRRIIEDKYLNGYDSVTNTVTNTERNPNYCTNPMSMTPETLGTSGIREDGTDVANSYFSYLVDKIPSSASHYQVKDGIQNVLSERSLEFNDGILYSVSLETGTLFGALSVDPSGIVTEIDAGRPTILLMQSHLGGTNHYVVAYGYNDYKYPGSQESYLGFITHFGWGSDDLNVWVNSALCCSYIKLEIDHTHNYSSVGMIGSTNRTEYKCLDCGHRTDQAPDNNYLNITNLEKSGGVWNLKVQNILNTSVDVYYNSKMCYYNDAKNWTGLSDIVKTTISGGSSKTLMISENNLATSIALSYIKNNVRNITYADKLNADGSFCIMHSSKNINSYTKSGMSVRNMGKNGSKWLIELTNNTGSARAFYYNKKMCFENDAKDWTGISDVAQTDIIKNGKSVILEIEEYGTATDIAISYIKGSTRYIFYADNLNTACTLSSYGNTKSYNSYTKNGMTISIVGKSSDKWLIELTNNTGSEQTFEYNSKMCFDGDAKDWKGLSDIASFTLANNASKQISISENAMATSIAISYLESTSCRKIIYANNLNTSGTMSVYESTIDPTASSGECVAAGTLITLADGSQVPIENLVGDEMLLVWNLESGTYDEAPILFIDRDLIGHYEVIKLSFSDGTTVDVISEHGFWDAKLNKYVYLDSDAAKYIGHSFLKQGEDGMTEVTLMDVDITTEVTTAYSPVTYGHLCYYVNGMLSMPGGIDGLFNIFEVESKTMTIDQDSFVADIEEYGLFTYEEFYEMYPISEEIFEAFNGSYLKVSIGKGLIDYETLGELIERYSAFFE